MSKGSRPRVVLVSRCFVIDTDGRILAIRRSSADHNNAGLWECPGGKLDEGQDLSDALEREVLEETGLLVEPISRSVTYQSYILPAGKYKGLPYIVLFGLARVVGGRLKLSEEHDGHAWFTFDELLDQELTLQVRKAAIVLESQLRQKNPGD